LRYNNLEDVDLIDNTVACVIVEFVQAETGITPANKEWLLALRKKCDALCALLIVDEIQSGFGRTGNLFAFEGYGVVPDILLVGKALGGGLPLGAFISDPKMMGTLTDNPVLGHITTFGGNPVSCAAGIAALNVLMESNWIHEVQTKEAYLIAHLTHPAIVHRNHMGLWMSLQFDSSELTKKIAATCIQNGIITDWFLFASHCMRIAPPLIIHEDEIRSACKVILDCCDEYANH